VAAILDFVLKAFWHIPPCLAWLSEAVHQISSRSVKRFKSYKTFSQIQDGGRRHLGFLSRRHFGRSHYVPPGDLMQHTKFQVDWSNGSKVTALILNTWSADLGFLTFKGHFMTQVT
jgi:hypothetical protein